MEDEFEYEVDEEMGQRVEYLFCLRDVLQSLDNAIDQANTIGDVNFALLLNDMYDTIDAMVVEIEG